MINELYELSKAIEQAGIQTQSWHLRYKPIPNIRPKAPCIRITISGGAVTELSTVDPELGTKLRKYGSNQGSYPCMNLVPLYRITDETVKQSLAAIRPEQLDPAQIETIKSWCIENNWNKKFCNKYKISMKNTTEELAAMLPKDAPIQILIEESNQFLDPTHLHQELENAVFRMLDNREQVALALHLLFHPGSTEKKPEEDSGTLSVALESPRLIAMEIPAVSEKFTATLNQALLAIEDSIQKKTDFTAIDAFGIPFNPIDEPMPEVKLAGGFDAKLRTMFKEQRCQARYGTIESASYPISPQMRKKLHAALTWLSSPAHKEITWINTDKDEILFAYPAQIPNIEIRFTSMLVSPKQYNVSFEERSKDFLEELKQSKHPGTDSHADLIQLFILRKIDKARTKVVYTRQTNPHELEIRSEQWTIGCSHNLPKFPFGQPNTPFPLDTADILNRFWKQNGELATDKFRPIPKYHGLELLMEPDLPIYSDLHLLIEKAMKLALFLSKKRSENNLQHPIWERTKEILALLGLLLHRSNVRKEDYMEQLPYLFGQLLKISDELHTLYCNVMRKGDVPMQLAGGSLFQAATEAPLRTLGLLGQRMNPYIVWAKSYRTKNVHEKNKESWRAGWLVSLFEHIATRLHESWQPETRLNDEEKAQLFIGYLAAFPKKEQTESELTPEQNQGGTES